MTQLDIINALTSADVFKQSALLIVREAVIKCGSRVKLAKRLNMHESTLRDIEKRRHSEVLYKLLVRIKDAEIFSMATLQNPK